MTLVDIHHTKKAHKIYQQRHCTIENQIMLSFSREPCRCMTYTVVAVCFVFQRIKLFVRVMFVVFAPINNVQGHYQNVVKSTGLRSIYSLHCNIINNTHGTRYACTSRALEFHQPCWVEFMSGFIL